MTTVLYEPQILYRKNVSLWSRILGQPLRFLLHNCFNKYHYSQEYVIFKTYKARPLHKIFLYVWFCFEIYNPRSLHKTFIYMCVCVYWLIDWFGGFSLLFFVFSYFVYCFLIAQNLFLVKMSFCYVWSSDFIWYNHF